MAEASPEKGKSKAIVSKAFQRWRENRAKRDLKSAGKHRFVAGLYPLQNKI